MIENLMEPSSYDTILLVIMATKVIFFFFFYCPQVIKPEACKHFSRSLTSLFVS
jgi:hypothetical protein